MKDLKTAINFAHSAEYGNSKTVLTFEGSFCSLNQRTLALVQKPTSLLYR
jgi:hypothetical protein